MADVSEIVKGFLLNAPPGEFLEVVSGMLGRSVANASDAMAISGLDMLHEHPLCLINIVQIILT
jgi:hypothetical protein